MTVFSLVMAVFIGIPLCMFMIGIGIFLYDCKKVDYGSFKTGWTGLPE